MNHKFNSGIFFLSEFKKKLLLGSLLPMNLKLCSTLLLHSKVDSDLDLGNSTLTLTLISQLFQVDFTPYTIPARATTNTAIKKKTLVTLQVSGCILVAY